MTYSKVSAKVKKSHPIHALSQSAKEIVVMWRKAMVDAGVTDEQLTIPLWIADEPKMKITIEVGPETEADYAIFRAQTK